MRYLFSVTILGCLTYSSNLVAQDPEVSIKGTTVANFRFGGQRFAIHPMLGNAEKLAEVRQYRYEPVLLPEVDKEGRLVTKVEPNGNEWTVVLRIALGPLEADRAAYASLLEAYPSDASRLRELNVGHLRPDKITFATTFPKELGGVVEQEISPGAARTITLKFPAANPATAKKVEDWLKGSNGQISCKYLVRTRQIQTDAIKITMKTLKGTTLHIALDGLPKDREGFVYVHRNDLRKLTEDIHRQITITGTIEDPSRFSDTLAIALLKRWGEQEKLDLAKWGEEKWKSTYHADDLKPDLIKEQLNKGFTKIAMKKEYEAHKHIL